MPHSTLSCTPNVTSLALFQTEKQRILNVRDLAPPRIKISALLFMLFWGGNFCSFSLIFVSLNSRMLVLFCGQQHSAGL